MSSMRIALKQSLEDAPPSASVEGSKKRRIKSKKNAGITKRGDRPGEPPKLKRKRGRPRKHPHPDDSVLGGGELGDSSGGAPAVGSTETHHGPGSGGQPHPYGQSYDDDDDVSSSENEFSYEEGEEDDDDDDEGEDENSEGEVGEEDDGGHFDEDDGEDEDDEDMRSMEEEDASTSNNKGPSNTDRHPIFSHVPTADSNSTHPDGSLPVTWDDPSILGYEHHTQQKVLTVKEKLKDSAANKIQNQWKKKKGLPTESLEGSAAVASVKQLSSKGDSGTTFVSGDSKSGEVIVTDATKAVATAQPNDSEVQQRDEKHVAEKKVAGVVPPPSVDVLVCARNIPENQSRKSIAPGLRVKVRFVTRVKKDGKFVKKKKWYGGMVTKVSKKGTKIKIKYDDGTSEVAKFPDKDVIVDAVMNGEHQKDVPVDVFLPHGDDKAVLEEGEVKTSPVAVPSPRKEESTAQPTEYQESSTSPVVQVVVKEKELEHVGNQIQVQDDGITALKPAEEPRTPQEKSSQFVGETGTADSQAIALLTSPEEGELSPGITNQSRPLVDLPQTDTIPGAEEESAPTTDGLSKEAVETSNEQSPMNPSDLKMDAASETPIAKLAIAIPTQQVTKDLTSNEETPALDEGGSIDNILVDTPVNEDRKKRKHDNAEGIEDEPPTRKIKVVADEAKETGDSQHKASEVAMDTSKGDSPSRDVDSNEQKPLSIKLILSPPSASDASKIEPLSTQHTGKKKKKRVERPRSPMRRSPTPLEVSTPPIRTEEKSSDNFLLDRLNPTVDPEIAPEEKALGDSLATEIDEEANVPSLKTVTSQDSFGGLSRGGRKAAQQAKQKLNTKEKEKDNTTPDPNKKKKKRKRMEELSAEVEDGDAPVWVQCDACGKWRILPSDVKVSSLPKWYCHMNVYDPKRSTCEAPEQTAKQAFKERKRALKRAKRIEAEAQQLEAKKEKTEQTITPVSSPKPTKAIKSIAKAKEPQELKKKVVAAISEEHRPHSDSGSETHKDEKKKGKKGKAKEIVDEVQETPVEAKKRKRGRPARNQNSSTPQPQTQENQDEDNVEWVQCEKCEKWRKLPPDISADELPDTWYCSMNTWNPSSASCTAAEDKTDAQHHEVGSSEWQLRQTHAGKYSYRQMIFGTGARKVNRPLSERSRAAESLFVKPVAADAENPIPTTQYSKSSSFLPRTSNFNKSVNSMDEENIGIFDVLSHSNLWSALSAMEQTKPMKVESCNFAGSPYPKFMTYENLPEDIKTGMQEVVLEILGKSALSGDVVLHRTKQYPWGNRGMIGYCNADVVINTLLSLVRDGIVEMATFRDPKVPMSQWIPQYRRVRSKRALAAEEAIKSSKCMKIAKPWKQREEMLTDSEWVTGHEAFN